LHSWIKWIEGTGAWSPWIFVGVFLAASLLTIWRLESMSAGGLDGTVIGTLVTPYMTGMGNLIFAFVMARSRLEGASTEVMKSCLVNNVTNMTLVLGVPAIFWSMNLFPVRKASGKKSAKSKKPSNAPAINRLSLLLTLLALLFFTGITWFLGADGRIDHTDGIVLVGIFLFWQCFHVFEVLKHNAQQHKHFNAMLPFDLALFGVGAYFVYASTDWLATWVSSQHTGFVSFKNIGWLAGWLNVLPNAILAIYYAWTRRPEIVYTSQVGDSHICIPLCVGVFALFKTIAVPSFFALGVVILLAATIVHIIFIGAFGRLPRYMGWLLTAAYAFFVWRGLLQ
jgi:cation:H+ antiporter